ncbi:MAG TPA: RDD family protein [Chitinophagales bacterium]|nr:RDD family protein [Chitinophagales bacterium]
MGRTPPPYLVGNTQQPSVIYAPLKKRLVNYFIDHIFTLTVTILVASGCAINAIAAIGCLFIVINFIYYTTMELFFSRTIAKFITGTHVTRENSLQRISLKQVLFRSACRLIPGEPISFLVNKYGWHDKWSKTMVIDVQVKTNKQTPLPKNLVD